MVCRITFTELTGQTEIDVLSSQATTKTVLYVCFGTRQESWCVVFSPLTRHVKLAPQKLRTLVFIRGATYLRCMNPISPNVALPRTFIALMM